MNKLQKVADYALGQDGYFSASQALEAGLTRQDLAYYKRENYIRSVCWGVYQLVSSLPAEDEELIALWLATDQRATVSHETALSLHKLSDVLPSRPSITLPMDWRDRRLKLPYSPLIFHADLEEADAVWRGCFRVTTPLRTLWDCEQSGTAEYLLVQAKAQAQQRGLVRAGDFQPLLKQAPEPNDQSSKGIDKVLDEMPCSCCPSRASSEHPYHFVRNYRLPFYSKPAPELLRSLQWAIMRSESQLLQNLAEPTQQRQLSPQVLEGKDGPVSVMEPISIDYDFSMGKQDILDGSFGNVRSLIEERAKEEVLGLEKWILDNLQRSTEAMGQVVRGSGGISHDILLDALEKVEIEFLPTGEVRDLQWILNPSDAKKIQEIPPTPAQEQRFQAIMQKKWREWNARQGRRRVR